MQTVKVQTWVKTDGELHLKGLPCKQWDRVEVLVLIPNRSTEELRQEALKRFQADAAASRFRSVGP